jgi:hypothetical protein
MEFTQTDVNLMALIWLVGWLAVGFYTRKTDEAPPTKNRPTLFKRFSTRGQQPKR